MDAIEATDAAPEGEVPDAPAETPELAGLREALAARDELPQMSEASRRAAVERLRIALVASEPGLRPGMVTGETVEEVEASFTAARQLVAEVRDALRREVVTAVPAGSPGRAASGPATPFDKIRAGLGRLAS
jgi:hypothetical protein